MDIKLFKKVKFPDFIPRAGDYYIWTTEEFRRDNRCYMPNIVHEVTKTEIIQYKKDSKNIIDTFTLNKTNVEYLMWYRPRKKIIII